jgi:hypothetical protein
MHELRSKQTPAGAASASKGRATGVERRTNTRYPFTATAEVIDVRSETGLKGRSADICLGGCYVDTTSPFPVGTPVTLRLAYQNNSFEAQAAVIYAHVGMGMGLAFTKVSPDQHAVLREWVRKLSGEPTPPADPPEAASAGEGSHEHERHVLNHLISLLIRKRLLTEAEGTALLRELFR